MDRRFRFQWVWNLRLELGQAMQAGQVREIEWAPPKEAPPVFVAEETPAEEYGPWQWAAAFGRATGRFGAEDFVWQEKGKLRCPAGASLWLSEVRQENAFTRALPSIWPTRLIVYHVPCGSSVSRQGPKAIALPASVPFAASCPRLRLLSASLSFSDRCGSRRCVRSSSSPHLDRPLAPAIRRDPSAYGHAAERFPSLSPTACSAFASPLELAGPTRTQCLVWTTAIACHCRWGSRFSGDELTKEELATKEAFSKQCDSPAEWISRARIVCLLTATCLSSPEAF